MEELGIFIDMCISAGERIKLRESEEREREHKRIF